jgi:ATP-dependent DNA helicase RecG
MLRDAGDTPQDSSILDGFHIEDLDSESIAAYRNRFSSRDPDHPFLALDHQGFLERLGAWRCDRVSGQKGITLAGLLMFGKERALLDALPHYQVDYQESPSDNPEVRWTYRLTVDGKWTPNLFQFYYRVMTRLVDGLDVPFQLDQNGIRIEETHVHEALREALVNSLVHADHQSTRPIVIIKKPDAYLFQNPGRLRIPREQLYLGGLSDTRNPSLQKMFQLIGLGEKAGSGFQKILRAWQEQTWMRPLVSEVYALEMTRIWLPLISMIPAHVEADLRNLVGDRYAELLELDRAILLFAHRFGEISNDDVQPFRDEHPRDIGERLSQLVIWGYLQKSGHGRGTRYWLSSSQHLEPSSSHSDSSSSHLALSSSHLALSSSHLDLSSSHLSLNKLKIARSDMESHILELCGSQWLTIQGISSQLNRNPNYLRNHYLNQMVQMGVLELRIPSKPTHPGQAYRKKQS